MELVELEPLANSIVGKPGISGLSVEQRKRLTIAVELVANPSIIFMVSVLLHPHMLTCLYAKAEGCRRFICSMSIACTAICSSVADRCMASREAAHHSSTLKTFTAGLLGGPQVRIFLCDAASILGVSCAG